MGKTSQTDCTRITKCRICGSQKLFTFLDLGTMPIPNGFLTRSQLKTEEQYFPLRACVCETCWLIQLTHVVAPSLMFRNYVYIPSTSMVMQEHFQTFAEDTITKYSLAPKSLVVDIGSNDGLLLFFFQKKKMTILGIDPAENLAENARKAGIPTECAFFTSELATKLVAEQGIASVVTATNVVAHIHDLDELCKGVQVLIGNSGVFIMEAPYAVDMMDRNEFDTIYHEHLSYFSVRPLQHLFKSHGLRIIDVEKQTVHGGTIRVTVASEHSHFAVHTRVARICDEEELKKLHLRDTYLEFAHRVKIMKRDVRSILKRIAQKGSRVVGYGAAAKGNVALNYFGITAQMMPYIVDSIRYKHHKYTPGTHIPIFPESKLLADLPEYAYILSWNFADEIIEKNRNFREKGGQFIIGVPYLRIV